MLSEERPWLPSSNTRKLAVVMRDGARKEGKFTGGTPAATLQVINTLQPLGSSTKKRGMSDMRNNLAGILIREA